MGGEKEGQGGNGMMLKGSMIAIDLDRPCPKWGRLRGCGRGRRETAVDWAVRWGGGERS